MSTEKGSVVAVHSKVDKLRASKGGRSMWVRTVEEEGWFFATGGRIKKNGSVSVWMEAACDGGPTGTLNTLTLGVDGNALIWADFGLGTQTPDLGPPGTVWSRPQDGAIFLERNIPSGLRGGAQFAMELFCVMMAQFFEQRIGPRKGGGLLCSEERREALLPEVVRALDLAFCLGSWGVAQGDLIKAQGAAELGESVWLTGEEK
jgi:hypothetical protein